jgi:hypothetical protein
MIPKSVSGTSTKVPQTQGGTMRPDDIGIRRNSDGRFPQIVQRLSKPRGREQLPKMDIRPEDELRADCLVRELAVLLSRHRQGVAGAKEKAVRVVVERFETIELTL